MKPIGGFFELKLPESKGSYHPIAINLCTGQACLNLSFRMLNRLTFMYHIIHVMHLKNLIN